MPIEYSIDHERRLVMARAHGVFTHDDVFGYQRGIWSQKDVAGYNELIDMTRVEHIALPSTERVRDLAKLAAAMDQPASHSKLAVVASEDIAFGLGRMFQAYRELDSRSTKEVGIFRTMQEALAFLEVDHPLAIPDPA